MEPSKPEGRIEALPTGFVEFERGGDRLSFVAFLMVGLVWIAALFVSN